MTTSSSSSPSPSSTESEPSPKINGDLQDYREGQSLKQQETKVTQVTPKRQKRNPDHHAAPTASPLDVLLFLVAFRILNALTLRTFFQPDEYFQSLEPAWRIAFGKDSGAWITWVGPFPAHRPFARMRKLLSAQSLTIRSGMEKRSSICDSPRHLRRCL
jgi:Alg9-like mannosyltransferase family